MKLPKSFRPEKDLEEKVEKMISETYKKSPISTMEDLIIKDFTFSHYFDEDTMFNDIYFGFGYLLDWENITESIKIVHVRVDNISDLKVYCVKYSEKKFCQEDSLKFAREPRLESKGMKYSSYIRKIMVRDDYFLILWGYDKKVDELKDFYKNKFSFKEVIR